MSRRLSTYISSDLADRLDERLLTVNTDAYTYLQTLIKADLARTWTPHTCATCGRQVHPDHYSFAIGGELGGTPWQAVYDSLVCLAEGLAATFGLHTEYTINWANLFNTWGDGRGVQRGILMMLPDGTEINVRQLDGREPYCHSCGGKITAPFAAHDGRHLYHMGCCMVPRSFERRLQWALIKALEPHSAKSAGNVELIKSIKIIRTVYDDILAGS